MRLLIRKLVTPFLSAQLHQDEDDLPLALSHSGPDLWASYRTLEVEVSQLHVSFVPPSELVCSDERRGMTAKGVLHAQRLLDLSRTNSLDLSRTNSAPVV